MTNSTTSNLSLNAEVCPELVRILYRTFGKGPLVSERSPLNLGQLIHVNGPMGLDSSATAAYCVALGCGTVRLPLGSRMHQRVRFEKLVGFMVRSSHRVVPCLIGRNLSRRKCICGALFHLHVLSIRKQSPRQRAIGIQILVLLFLSG